MWTDELIDLLVSAHVGFLDHVLGLGAVSDDAACQAIKAPVVATHDELERDRITGPDAINQLGIFSGSLVRLQRSVCWLGVCLNHGHTRKMKNSVKRFPYKGVGVI